MQKDEILAEVHKARDQYGKQHDHDLKKIYEDLKRQQEKNMAAGQKYESFPAKRPKQAA